MLFKVSEVFIVLLLAPLVMCATSLVYFRAGGISNPLQGRALAAAHGLLGTFVFMSAFLVASVGKPEPNLREPYLALWLVPLTFVGISVWRFKGPKRTHLLLPPLLAAMGWAVVVGYTIVGGGK